MTDKEWLVKAYNFAQKYSQDPRTQVGAVLVANDHIPLTYITDQIRLAYGTNQLPHGVRDLPERSVSPAKHSWFVHAEVSCLSTAANFGECTCDTTLYVTLRPCNTCAMSIIACGVRRVVYHEADFHPEPYECHKIGLQMLKEAKVEISVVLGKLNCGTILFDGQVVEV